MNITLLRNSLISNFSLVAKVSLLWLLFQSIIFADMRAIPSPPQLPATSYLLLDFDSGYVIAEKGSQQQLPPASLTKIMTAYVVASELESGRINLDDEVLISEKAWRAQGSRMFIEVGKHVSVNKLLLGVIVQSGNDASIALAEFIAGSEDAFADMMNQHAKRLGMLHTHFVNSTGLPDPEHYTTAYDLAILSQALISDYPDIYSLHKQRSFTFNNIKQYNRNGLLWRDKRVDGIKTGHTEQAGYCLVVSALDGSMRLISVVLGSGGKDSRIQASQTLLNYGFRYYETHRLYQANEEVAAVKVWSGEEDDLPLYLDAPLYATIPVGYYEQLKTLVQIEYPVLAPVQQSQNIGKLLITLDDEKLMEAPLFAMNAINEGGMLKRLADKIRLLLSD